MALLGKKLTAQQQRIWDAQQRGRTYAEIAAELGISVPVVAKTLFVVRKKLGVSPDGKRGTGLNKGLIGGPKVSPLLDPAQIPAAVEEVNATMKRVGLPERIREGMVRRLAVKHGALETAPKAISDDDMKTRYREKIGLAFSYMDDKAMSEASFRDLSVGVTAMTEKLQLLEGKPTQIISDLERKHLNELMPLLIKEAERRGAVIPGVVTEKVINP